MSPRSLSHGGGGNQDGQEVCKCQEDDNHNDNKDKKSLSRADEEKEKAKDAHIQDHALVYHVLSKIFLDMDAYIYIKQRKISWSLLHG